MPCMSGMEKEVPLLVRFCQHAPALHSVCSMAVRTEVLEQSQHIACTGVSSSDCMA